MAVHQLGQRAADGQTQPGVAKAAGGGAGQPSGGGGPGFAEGGTPFHPARPRGLRREFRSGADRPRCAGSARGATALHAEAGPAKHLGAGAAGAGDVP